jgi:hypothetical protein
MILDKEIAKYDSQFALAGFVIQPAGRRICNPAGAKVILLQTPS